MKKNLILGFLLAIAILTFSVSASTVTLRPNGNGYYSAWVNVGCNSTAEWDCVNEASASTSDYLYTSRTNAKESFQFTNTGISGAVINNVTFYYYAKRYNPSKYKIRPLIRINSTNYFGNVIVLGSSFSYKNQIFIQNPATGSPWTISDLNNLEAGMNTYSSNPGGYVAQVYAVVDYTPLPDLIISSINLSQSSAYEGEVVQVSVTTRNIGTVTAGSSTTRVANGGNNDFSVGALSSGSSQINSFNYTCGTSNVSFTGTADIFGVVSETNEGNNQFTKDLTCLAKPDLIISNLSFQEYTGENSTNVVNITFYVTNYASGVSGNSTTLLLGLIGEYRFTPPINPWGSYWMSMKYDCTAAHNFTTTADVFNAVSEKSESNNQEKVFIDCII